MRIKRGTFYLISLLSLSSIASYVAWNFIWKSFQQKSQSFRVSCVCKERTRLLSPIMIKSLQFYKTNRELKIGLKSNFPSQQWPWEVFQFSEQPPGTGLSSLREVGTVRQCLVTNTSIFYCLVSSEHCPGAIAWLRETNGIMCQEKSASQKDFRV